MNMLETIKKNFKTEEKDNTINHIFDYSNAVPTKDSISHLVKYCDSVYEHYLWLLKEDDKKANKHYSYQKKYVLFLDVRIKDKKFNTIICNSYASLKKAILDDNLDNVDSMEIRLNLDYKKNDIIYNNLFTILIKPFNLKFIRKSSSNQLEMNVIENNINEILKRFQIINSIFCTK